jgi:hypothetical protein
MMGAFRAHQVANEISDKACIYIRESLQLAGHTVSSYLLNNTRKTRLLFPLIKAAHGPADPDGDLYRMWKDPSFVATPFLNPTPPWDPSLPPEPPVKPYTRDSLLAMLRAIIAVAKPDYMRTLNPNANRDDEHIDHITAALFAAEADTGMDRRTLLLREEYYSYPISNMAPNVDTPWISIKLKILEAYQEWDEEAKNATITDNKNKQYIAQRARPGDLWQSRAAPF